MLDFIGIGLGPFNLSLASLLHDKSGLQYRFLISVRNLTGMLVCNCQTRCYKFLLWLIWLVWLSQPALLVLNYLKHHQRLYKFYFRENLYIPRQEYNHYCQWVVEQLNHIEFSSHVLDIKPIIGGFDVEVVCNGHHQHYRTRQLVLGVGTTHIYQKAYNRFTQNQEPACIHQNIYSTAPRSYQEM